MRPSTHKLGSEQYRINLGYGVSMVVTYLDGADGLRRDGNRLVMELDMGDATEKAAIKIEPAADGMVIHAIDPHFPRPRGKR